MRRIASIAIAIVLAALCSGCAAAGAASVVSTVAPMVAAGSAQVIGSQVALKQANGTGASAEDNSDQCDQLLRVPPGVEEVLKTKDGVIESRQWKIGGDSGSPAWVLVHTNGGSNDSWQPKPGITKLFFNPPSLQHSRRRAHRPLTRRIVRCLLQSIGRTCLSIPNSLYLSAWLLQSRDRFRSRSHLIQPCKFPQWPSLQL